MAKLIDLEVASEFPELPEGYRWKINHPIFDTQVSGPLRRVKIQKRGRLFWKTVEWSVWNLEEGLGDMSLANPEQSYKAKGLANTMGYLLGRWRLHEEGVKSTLHGVSTK